MQKVFLAIGHREVEKYIKKNLEKEYNFVGETVYREGILKGLAQYNPNILIVRETLGGSKNITEIIYEIRTSFPEIRIIFIAGKREPGDVLLSTLVGYGIWDILTGEKINVKDIIHLVKNPNQFINVMNLQPKTTVDENTNKKIFEAPEPIVEKVYIERQVTIKENDLNQNKEEYYDDKPKFDPKPEPEPKAEPKVEPKTEIKEEIVKTVEPLTKNDTSTENKKRNKLGFEDVEPEKENRNKTLFKKRDKKDEINFAIKNSKQQIITFLGSKQGVGNTHVALNTALKLSQRGFKTIFLELNDKGSTVSYLYQTGSYYYGIDTAINAIKNEDYENVDKALVTTKNLIKTTPKDNLMLKNYKKLPETLDFMFFSEQYVQNRDNIKEEIIDYSLIKDLCMYLTFQKEYDFIILDVEPNIYNKMTKTALAYATSIFCTITQDVCSVSSNITQLTEMVKNRINIKDKIYYILNKYVNTILTPKDIEDWISENVGFDINIGAYIPDLNKEFIEANYVGLPMLLYTKNKEFVNTFSEIEKKIF